VSKPNRYDVTRAIEGLSPATTSDVAHKLKIEAGSAQLERALENASRHGLIEGRAPVSDAGQVSWKISDKGRRKIAAQ
jgi:hypothetical protein